VHKRTGRKWEYELMGAWLMACMTKIMHAEGHHNKATLN
jgi:hypothetical protein